MRETALFVEDYAHRAVVGALVRRVVREAGIEARFEWRNASGGAGRVARELRDFLSDLDREAPQAPGARRPDLVIVATDANCRGVRERAQEILPKNPGRPFPIVLAIPDSHIERWLLLDGAAFRKIFGRGCDAPDSKCARNRYKQMLTQQIAKAGMRPPVGGIEFAEDLVEAMDLDRAARADRSLARFLSELTRALQTPGAGARD